MIAIHLARLLQAMGQTDMLKEFDGPSMLAQEVLKQAVLGALVRGRSDLVKVLYWDGQAFCLFAKRQQSPNSNVSLAQVSTPAGTWPSERIQGAQTASGKRWDKRRQAVAPDSQLARVS